MESVLMPVIIAFVAACLFALVLTPLVMRLALKLGAVDQPNDRKAHALPMPRMGGVAVLVSFVLAMVVLRFVDPALEAVIWTWDWEGGALVLALGLMLALGIWDDITTLGPGRKFVAELAIASLVYAAGFKISIISFPNTAGHLQLDVFQYLVTVVWIIGVTNAVNLIDGLDGLASGVAMIACLTIAPIAYLNSDFSTAVLAILLAGGLLGFLRYNFNPAKVFLGDSGSLVLGFTLAVLSIRSSTKASTAFAILVPMLALGLPIMETLLSMVRRFLKPGEAASKSLTAKLKMMFLPDNRHIHHRLLASGLSHRSVVLVLYVVSCVLGAGAFALSIVHNVTSSLILLIVGTAAVLGIRHLRYTEMAVLKNGILLPLYDQDLINRETFQGFLDVFFVLGSFLAARQIIESRSLDHIFARDAIVVATAVCVIQYVILLLSGLYKGSIRHMGVKEMLRTTKAVALAVIVTGVVFFFVGTPLLRVQFGTLVLDFYLLLSCILGSRVSFKVLTHLSQPGPEEGTRVLLYGAGVNGRLVLDKITSGKLAGLVPVGFLDDDPHLEGKRINGFTVFGGHWKLRRVLNRMKIDELLLVTDQIRPEILRRLDAMTRPHGTRVRKLSVTLEDMKLPGGIPSFEKHPFGGSTVNRTVPV